MDFFGLLRILDERTLDMEIIVNPKTLGNLHVVIQLLVM